MPQQFLYRPPQEYRVRRVVLAPGGADGDGVFYACRGFLLVCAAQGACRLDLGSRELLADAAGAVLLGPDVPFRLRPCGSGAVLLAAEFSAAFLAPLGAAAPDYDLTAFLTAEPVRALTGLPAAVQRDLRAGLQGQCALCAPYPDTEPLPAAVLARGRLLLAALLLALAGLYTATPHGGTPLAEQLRRYIAVHYAERLDLTVLAQRFHTSRWHLCRAFKAGCGQSPIEYLNATRVQAACALLEADEPLPLEEIARRCGCSGAAQLRRLFKAQTGQSPRQYRRAARG